MNAHKIRFIKNKDIDFQKWDECLACSSVPLIYAESWYLDVVAPNWDALVWGDYEYIMPLNVKQKLGITFLLQPIYAQQHGIFPEADPMIQFIFLSFIYNRFKYVAIHLNAMHSAPFPEGFSVNHRNNFILNLASDYETLAKNYSKHTRRQIKKATAENVFVIKGVPVNEYINLKNLAARKKLSQKLMQTLKLLITHGNFDGKGTIYGAYDRQNSLCAAAFFIHSGRRTVYLNAVSTTEGKNTSAMYLIVDQFIREFSASSLTLDFEGSSIPGIARFYQGFGAECEQYFSLKSNRLPIPVKWILK